MTEYLLKIETLLRVLGCSCRTQRLMFDKESKTLTDGNVEERHILSSGRSLLLVREMILCVVMGQRSGSGYRFESQKTKYLYLKCLDYTKY